MENNETPDPRLYIDEVREKLSQAKNITILTHLNPDADTIGTGLGIYTLLSKERSKKVEIVNASNSLPRYLDFLPHFSKIKDTMDFEESLVITCDCGNIERLGVNLDNRDIINVDHHISNENYGAINVVIPEYASASQVAYALFKHLYTIDKSAASCFYTALLSDTQYFTTSSVNAEVFEVAKELVDLGVDPAEVAQHFTQRRSLASLRILEKALGNLSLKLDAKVAILYVTHDDIDAAGATMPDMEGIVDYAKSLVTVEVGVFVMETEEGLRVSLRSKGADVSIIAREFGGGGHRVAAGFTLTQRDIHETIDIILKTIQNTGLSHGKK